MQRPRHILSASLAASILLLAGCSSVPLDKDGEAEAVYQINEFRMLVNSTAPAAYNATRKAMRELDLFEIKTQLNTYDAQVYARSRNDDKVYVGIAEQNSRQTLIRIRWGITGDKKNSQALYQLIERNLR